MPLYERPNQPEATLDDEETEIQNNTPAVNAEDANWKKRYGDLRSHTTKQLNELKTTIKDLSDKLNTVTSQKIELPTSPEEVDAWAKKYPQIAAIVETIALQKAKKVNEDVESRLNSLRETQQETAKEQAKLKLKGIHNDFDDIASDEKFHTWLANKSKRTQDTIYENDLDYEAAAETISLFKLETNWGKPQRRQERPADAAREVRNNRVTEPGSGQGKMFRESDVLAMNPKEYEQLEPEIDAAIREGRFVYDVKDAEKAAARG